MTKSNRIRKYFHETYGGNWVVGSAKDLVTAVQKQQSGIPYGITVPSSLVALALDCGADDSYYGSGRNATLNVVKQKMNDGYLDMAIPYFQTHPLKTLIISGGDLTGCGGIENLFYRLKNQPCCQSLEQIDLSGNNMIDYGANYIIESIKSGRYPSLKYIDISNNGITPLGMQLIRQGLSKIKQDIVIVYSNSSDSKLGFHKNAKDSHIYDLSLKPTSDRCDITIHRSPISGVSAGDDSRDCPMSIKEQIAACVAGATGGGAAGVANCAGKSKDPRIFGACVGRAALIGCAAKVAAEKCIASTYEPSSSKNCNSKEQKGQGCDGRSGDKCDNSNKGCGDKNGDMSGRCPSKSYF